MLKIIDWNISWCNDIENKIKYLKQITLDCPFIIILQEVKVNAYEALEKAFLGIANIEYSLKYRVPGKFDTDSRKLGIAILTSKGIKVIDANVLERSLMPDRTLMMDIEYKQQKMRVLGLHSITGCQHGKAKSIQYFAFAEAIEEFKPDIVGIDANEPELDHYDVSKMEFFDNYDKGKGCKTFFETMNNHFLEDAYVRNYDINAYIEGEYLTTSFVIQRNRKNVRYDFLFVNKGKFENYDCVYDYEGAINAGSDHAAIIFSANDEM